jgi:hypothetical protein
MDDDPATNSTQPVYSGAQRPRLWQSAAILLSLPAIAGCLLLGVLVFCTTLGLLALIGQQAQLAESGPIVAAFMTAMEAHDVESAYDLLSTRARLSISRADLETMLDGDFNVLFDGYERVDIVEGTIAFKTDTDDAAPQGWVAQVGGSVYYTDGSIGTFEATLELDGDTWRLHGIQVTVPPDKLSQNPFLVAGQQAEGVRPC